MEGSGAGKFWALAVSDYLDGALWDKADRNTPLAWPVEPACGPGGAGNPPSVSWSLGTMGIRWTECWGSSHSGHYRDQQDSSREQHPKP